MRPGSYLHLHRRKRIHKDEYEPYPSPNLLKRTVDRLIYAVIFISPALTVPQVYKIWIVQNASGISLITWTSYFFTSSFWLFYAGLHKEKPLIISYILWIFLEILIILGTILYG